MINNRMEKKFIKVLESAMSRYTRAGFLVGDYVEFVKNYKSLDSYKELQDLMRETIDDLIKSGLRIRVVGVDDYYPVRFPGSAEHTNGKVTIKIAADHGGGRNLYAITVCSKLLTVLDFYPNLAPLPDQFTRPNNEILQPKEVGEVQGAIKGANYSLPTSNVELKITKSKKKKGESYTASYIQ